MIPEVPAFVKEELLREYGEAVSSTIMAGYQANRPVTLRVNRLKATLQDVTQALDGAGIAWQPVPWYEDALILPEAVESQVEALPIYQAGGIYLQSLSSMLPVLLMDLQPGQSVLDMAAAPGGKTTQMASLSGNSITITACERDAIRAERLRFNLERQGVKRANVMQLDARNLDNFFRFDNILLDAPCTGSGTILVAEGEKNRRMEPGWVRKTVQTQVTLLKKALTLLSAGKTMVYSTCSAFQLENEEVLRQVLKPGSVELVPVSESLLQAVPTLPTTLPGTLTVCPTEHFEGFFAAKLKKLK